MFMLTVHVIAVYALTVVDVLCADDDEAAAEAGVEADGRCELGRG